MEGCRWPGAEDVADLAPLYRVPSLDAARCHTHRPPRRSASEEQLLEQLGPEGSRGESPEGCTNVLVALVLLPGRSAEATRRLVGAACQPARSFRTCSVADARIVVGAVLCDLTLPPQGLERLAATTSARQLAPAVLAHPNAGPAVGAALAVAALAAGDSAVAQAALAHVPAEVAEMTGALLEDWTLPVTLLPGAVDALLAPPDGQSMAAPTPALPEPGDRQRSTGAARR